MKKKIKMYKIKLIKICMLYYIYQFIIEIITILYLLNNIFILYELRKD